MSKTLILVEGAKTDIKLMTHILKLYEISSEHEIQNKILKILEYFHESSDDCCTKNLRKIPE